MSGTQKNNPTFLSRILKRWYIHLFLFPISLPIEYLAFISQPDQVEKRQKKAEAEKSHIDNLPKEEKEAYLEKKESDTKNAIRLSLIVILWLMLGSVAFVFYAEPDYPYQVGIGFLLFALGIWLHPMKGERFFSNRLAKLKEHKVRMGLTVVALVGAILPFINTYKQSVIENYPEPIITILSKEGDLGEASEYELKVRAENTDFIRVEGEGEMKAEGEDTYSLTLDLEELSNTFNIIAENEHKQSEMSLVVTRDETELEKEERLAFEAEEAEKRKPVEYEIVVTEDQSRKAIVGSLSNYTTAEIEALPMDKKMLYKVVLPPTTKETQVEPTVDKIIEDVTSQDKDIDEITIFLYSNKEGANGPWDLGKAVWAPFGELGNITPQIAQNNLRSDYDTSIEIKEDLEVYLSQRNISEEKFGLSEDQRREIYKELALSEQRARKESEAKYPYPDASQFRFDVEQTDTQAYARLDYDNELREIYENEVLTKYNIDKNTLTQIIGEAMDEGWPYPEY